MNVRLRLLSAVLIVAAAAGCRAKPRFAAPVKLGGQTVSPDVLNDGYEAYMHYCYACHGEKGDGQGPSAPGMRPPPRDFTAGMFKFAGVAAGELPNDDDLMDLVKNGLVGTPMLAWDIPERERRAVVQYIKTFSPRWQTETPGDRIVPDKPDPWTGKEDEAIARGRRIYHLTGVEMDPVTNQPKTIFAGCVTCHPAYVSRDELNAMTMKLRGERAEFRDETFLPTLKESEYAVGQKKIGVLAIDFLTQPVKNGTEPRSLFRTIAAGVGGTAMPQWKGALTDEALWALAHYVRSLAIARDTAAATALRATLK